MEPRSIRFPASPLFIPSILFATYAGIFIFKSSFTNEGIPFFCLFDDAMISMRFARNFAEGHGLVWNIGEAPVEGFSNPLWMLIMVFIHLFRLPANWVSLPMQVLGAVCVAISAFYSARIAAHLWNKEPNHASAPDFRGFSLLIAGLAFVLSAFYLPLNTWSMMGMEAGFMAALAPMATWQTLRHLDGIPGRLAVLFGLMAILVLTRADGIVTALGIILVLAWYDGARKLSHLVKGLSVVFGVFGILTLSRWLYFGELLPNTYYLKMTGFPTVERILAGTHAAGKFLTSPFSLLVVAVLAHIILRERAVKPAPEEARTNSRFHLFIPLFLFAWQIAYSVYVGGDAWEWFGGANRYMLVAIPGFFAVVAISLARLARSSKPTLLIFGALALFCSNLLKSHPMDMRRWLLLEKPLHADDHAKVAADVFRLKDWTTPEAKIAAVWIGITGYFSGRATLDMLGKCDPVVARQPMHRRHGKVFDPMGFWPGHLKWDYSHTIAGLKPDLVYQQWLDWAEADVVMGKEFSPRCPGFKGNFRFRLDSPHIHRSRISCLEKPISLYGIP